MEKLILDSMNLAHDVYNNLADEKSKYIFENRIMYSLTKDNKYIQNILCLENEFHKLFDNRENQKIVIFGAGAYGKDFINRFKNVKWECFADNYVKEKEIMGLKVIDFYELKKNYFNEMIVISSLDYHNEMYEQLINEGFDKDNIVNFGGYMQKKLEQQYFEFPLEDNKKQSFVDAGCYDGYSAKRFSEWCSNNYSNIWSFEPDPINYEVCKNSLKLDKCKLYNKGLFNKKGSIKFYAKHAPGAKICDDGDIDVEIDKLDDLLENEEVTFIKMDIEGAELAALQGAENIIKIQKPRLAISVYHKPEDIITIPNLLLKYNKDYKFKLRHYSCCEWETVLYAF